MPAEEMICTGRENGRKPVFRPYARGMFMVIQENREHEVTEDDMMKINLHAQKVLSAQSPEFATAQKHWTTLSHTPARQMDNRLFPVTRLGGRTDTEQEWIDQYASQEGIVYIFQVESEIDLRSGETRKRMPVIGFSFSRGIETLDDMDDKYCIRYRVYFAYAEK